MLATHPSAEVRNGAQAVEYAERACEVTSFKIPVLLGTLAAAYAESGQFDSAVQTAQKAEELARAQNQTHLVERNHKLGELYASHKAYREPQ